MTAKRRVAVLVGSLRRDSLNRKTAQALVRLGPDSLDFEFPEIGDLPAYNEDLEGEGAPQPWQRFRGEMASCEAVLFVTPEYNRSVPGLLKNAIDVGSRPYGSSIWSGKPAAVVSVSPGGIGGFGANHHLRQSMVFLDMPVMQQPEAYLGGAGGFFDDQGEVKIEGTRKFLGTIINSFASWVERILAERDN